MCKIFLLRRDKRAENSYKHQQAAISTLMPPYLQTRTRGIHPTLLLKAYRKSSVTTRNRKSLQLSSSGPLQQHKIWGRRIFGKPKRVKRETPVSPMPKKATSSSRTYHSLLISINRADRFHSVIGPSGVGKSSVGCHV